MIRRLLLALTLAGCTANAGVHGFVPGASPGTAARPAAKLATLTFRVDIPPATRKAAHFISPSTQSAAFVLYPLSGTERVSVYVNLTTETNQRCRMLRKMKTLRCRVVLHPQVGQYRASISTFDGSLGTNGLPTGHKLSANNDLPVYVPSYGVTIGVAIYLNGIPRSVRVSAAMAGDQNSGFSLEPCQRFPKAFTLTALDADGNVIIGPGAPTATLQPSAGLTVSLPDSTAPNEFEVDADPNASPGPATLTATLTANGAGRHHSSGATVNVSTVPVQPDGCLLVGNDEILGSVRNVLIFAPGSADPVTTMTDGIEEAYAFAFDGSKNMYVGNMEANTVTEYPQNSATPIRMMPSDEPWSVALDSSGSVFTADFAKNTVSVFPTGASTPSYQINVVQPSALAFDGSGNLYVASFYAPVAGTGTVSVYAPGSATPSRTIDVGVEADALAFDHAGKLYVANRSDNSVMVFSPGASSPSYTIAAGISEPRAIAVDSTNTLYVANYRSSTVTEYSSGQSTPSRTLSTGIHTWTVTVDANDRLYVGTDKRVYVYAEGSSAPSQTITNGIVGAITLAVTP